MDLFSPPPRTKKRATAPLADRVRPSTFEEFIGQERVAGQGCVLRQALLARTLPSIILWGPPGSGKTTLAYLIAEQSGENFVAFSAVTSGVKEIKNVIQEARQQWTYHKKRTILFVDEIHRFNKAQQDAFLPHIENGTIILIGATTENPSFEVIAPLLSRTRVFTLDPLEERELVKILERAIEDNEKGLGTYRVDIDSAVMELIANYSDGDARTALNTLELAVLSTPPGPDGTRLITPRQVEEALQRKTLRYDKAGEEHYNLISALHKSLRDSDPDGALYWLARMLVAGEDPLYVARRMVRFASEDIGNADPAALQVAIAGYQAYQFLGSPEGELSLAQVALYLASALKSNAVYRAFGEALRDAKDEGTLPVPLHIRNAPTRLMKEMGYGRGYQYAHNFPEAVVSQEHLPDKLKGRIYYRPSGRGVEAEIGKRLERWRQMRRKRRK